MVPAKLLVIPDKDYSASNIPCSGDAGLRLGRTSHKAVSARSSVLTIAAHLLRGENVSVFVWQPAQVFDLTGKRGRQRPWMCLITCYFLVVSFPFSLRSRVKERKREGKPQLSGNESQAEPRHTMNMPLPILCACESTGRFWVCRLAPGGWCQGSRHTPSALRRIQGGARTSCRAVSKALARLGGSLPTVSHEMLCEK